MGHSHRRLVGSPPSGNARILGGAVAVLGMCRSTGSFDQGPPEPGRAFTGTGRSFLACGLIAGRCHPSPGAQVSRCWELGHVAACFYDDRLCGSLRNPRNGAEQADLVLEGGNP